MHTASTGGITIVHFVQRKNRQTLRRKSTPGQVVSYGGTLSYVPTFTFADLRRWSPTLASPSKQQRNSLDSYEYVHAFVIYSLPGTKFQTVSGENGVRRALPRLVGFSLKHSPFGNTENVT